MSNINYIPTEDDYKQELTSSLGDLATDIIIYVDETPVYSPATIDTIVVLEPGTERAEACLVESYDSSAGTITLKAGGRGQDIYYGDARTTKRFEHPAGSEIIITDNYRFWSEIMTAVNSKLDSDGGNGAATFDLQVTGSDFRIRLDGSDMKLTDGNQAEVSLSTLAAAAGVDDKVKVSIADTTSGYLQGKINAGTGLDEAIGTPGGDETLDLSVDVTDIIDTTAGITEAANKIQVKLATDSGLQFTGGGLQAVQRTPLSVEIVAGEAIDGSATPQAISIGGESFKRQQLVGENTFGWGAPAGGLTAGNIDARYWLARSFIPNCSEADEITIESVQLCVYEAGVVVDTWKVEIYSDLGGLPDAIIANGVSGNVSGDLGNPTVYQAVRFTFATPPVVSHGVTYWIVLKRNGVTDAAKYWQWGNAGAEAGAAAYYTFSTSTWGVSNNGSIASVEYNLNLGGKAFKAAADNLARCNYVGMTSSNVAAAADISLQTGGIITMSGLNKGEEYMLDTTTGALVAGSGVTHAARQCLISGGRAISDTELLIEPSKTRYIALGSVDVVDFLNGDPGATKTLYMFCETGFMPKEITLSARWEMGAGASDRSEVRVAHYDLMVTGNLMSAMDGTAVAGASWTEPRIIDPMGEGANNGITVSGIYQNGFMLEIDQNTNTKYISSFTWTAKG